MKFLIPLILLTLSIATILSGRKVDSYGVNSVDLLINNELSVFLLQLGTGFILFISIYQIILFFSTSNYSLWRSDFLIPVLILFTSVKIFPAFLGYLPNFKYQLLYPLIVFIALLIRREDNFKSKFLIIAKNSLLIYILASIILSFIIPEVTVQNNYYSFYNLFNQRLWGLSAHANNLGANSALCILLIIYIPYKKKILNHVSIFALVICLIWSQSKTTIISLLISLFLSQLILLYNKPKKNTTLLLILILNSLLLFSISYFFLETEFNLIANKNSYNGRGTIWIISIEKLKNNLLFGYGNQLWNLDFATKYGFEGIATNSHNQVIQILASSGLFGLMGFLFFNLKLFFKLKNFKNLAKNKLLLPTTLFFIVRGITEVPLGMENVITSDFAMTSIFLVIITDTLYNRKKTNVN